MAARPNQYPGTCEFCRQPVAAKAGEIFKDRSNRWRVAHKRGECNRVSDEIRIGDNTSYRNKRGLCEDVPCCGCCTI